MVRSLRTLEMLAILAVCLAASIALFNGALSAAWLVLAIIFAAGLVMWIAVQDITDYTIPDGAIAALAAAGALVRFGTTQDGWEAEFLRLVLDAAVCGLAFLAIRETFFRARGFDGMGFGDVKLAAAAGILVGMEGFAWSVFAASTLGLTVVLLVSVLTPGRKVDRLPFGALLAPACWATWLAQLWSLA